MKLYRRGYCAANFLPFAHNSIVVQATEKLKALSSYAFFSAATKLSRNRIKKLLNLLFD